MYCVHINLRPGSAHGRFGAEHAGAAGKAFSAGILIEADN